MCPTHTCSSLIDTHELAGKSCRKGTRNCRHPFQWPSRSIRQIRLKMRINIPATLKNWKRKNHDKLFFLLFVCCPEGTIERLAWVMTCCDVWLMKLRCHHDRDKPSPHHSTRVHRCTQNAIRSGGRSAPRPAFHLSASCDKENHFKGRGTNKCTYHIYSPTIWTILARKKCSWGKKIDKEKNLMHGHV